MANNFVHNGQRIEMEAPAGGVKSGDGLVIENLFVVALTDAAAGDPFACRTDGAWTLPKAASASGKDFDAGEAVFWNAGEDECDKSATGRFRIGVAMRAAESTDEHMVVRLDGVSVVAVA